MCRSWERQLDENSIEQSLAFLDNMGILNSTCSCEVLNKPDPNNKVWRGVLRTYVSFLTWVLQFSSVYTNEAQDSVPMDSAPLSPPARDGASFSLSP